MRGLATSTVTKLLSQIGLQFVAMSNAQAGQNLVSRLQPFRKAPKLDSRCLHSTTKASESRQAAIRSMFHCSKWPRDWQKPAKHRPRSPKTKPNRLASNVHWCNPLGSETAISAILQRWPMKNHWKREIRCTAFVNQTLDGVASCCHSLQFGRGPRTGESFRAQRVLKMAKHTGNGHFPVLEAILQKTP